MAVNQNMIATMAAARLKAQHPTVFKKLNYLVLELARLGLEDQRLDEMMELFTISLNNGLRDKPTTINAKQGNKSGRQESEHRGA